ncbi:MAG: inositol monophosphatase, partial [Deltaproteobacteria bacterium]|nr:inositol monophosphatase [Deltaproteobacteria bacterium]
MELAQAAVEIARGAGGIVMRHYRERAGVVARKSSVIDLVTAADRESEAHVLAEIARRFPDHVVWAEESGKRGHDGPFRWVIDPLDGTSNFAHRLPHFCVLVAVQERDARGDFKTVVGVTLDPVRDELFLAVRGKGATLNGEPIAVSKVGRLIDAVATTGFAYDRLFRDDNNHAEFCRMNLLTQGCRRMGAAGLDFAYTACGRVDVFWEYGLSP